MPKSHLPAEAGERKPFAVRIFEFLRKISSWFLPRLTCFVLLVMIAHRVPGWAKGPLWLVVLLTGIWAFLALIRESRMALDSLIPLLQRWRCVFERAEKFQRSWKIAGLLCAAVIVTITLYRAWPIWSFKATSSLREDEIMSIARYTSRGFVPAISTYHIARNHIFYNIVSSLIPGADSTLPLRARLVSFASVISSLVLLIAYAWRRGWLLPGLACAGLVAVNFFAMDSVLEARGYGLIFLLAMLGCVAFAEWLRTRGQIWLNVMAVSCVLGTYTLPFYVLFGGSLLLLGFLYRPSRETLLAGFLSLVAIAMLYLPIVSKVYAVFTGYESRYGKIFISPFRSVDGVFLSLQYFFPRELLQIGALNFTLLALVVLLYAVFGRFAGRYDRVSFAGVAVSILAFLAFCVYCKIVPIRVASYIAAPLAFLAVLMTGSILSIRFLAPVRPYIDVLFTVLAAVMLWKSEVSKPLISRDDWRSLGVLIERAFPKEIRIWMSGDSPSLLQWNLSSRAKPEHEAFDRDSMGNGQLVAVEGYTAPNDEKQRFRWEDLPEDVRFVTSPLALNYHRVFFVPPKQPRIASISVNNQQVEPHVSGRQPYDPGLLLHSVGHGDVLRPKNAGDMNTRSQPNPEAPIAQPSEILLPAVITVELDPEASAGTCNLLFTQSLQDKKISVRINNSGSNWRETSNVFVLGELASIALGRDDCKAIRIHVDKNPSFSNRITDTARPPFGLLDAWTAPGKARLP